MRRSITVLPRILVPMTVVRLHSPQRTELWQTWCMRWTENPENVVQLHEVPQKKTRKNFVI